LRKSHFNFGSDKEGFITTNMERFQKSALSNEIGDPRLIAQGKERIRSVHITYGNEKPRYESS
jgi:hypothetical protein